MKQRFDLLTVAAVTGVSLALCGSALAQPRPDWQIPGGQASIPTVPAPPAPRPAQPAASAPATGTDLASIDTSEEVLLADRALADRIFDEGPMAAYLAAVSPTGVLIDGQGAGAEGEGGVRQRFASFPEAVRLDRRPDSAIASGASGSSWGTYALRRGDAILTEGHYITTWRREAGAWKIVAELAAGRAAGTGSGAAGQAPQPARPAAPAGVRRPQPAAPASAPTAASELPPMRDALGRPVGTVPPATGSQPGATPRRP